MSLPIEMSQPPKPGSEEASVPLEKWHGPRIIFTGFVTFMVSTGLIFSIWGVVIGPIAESFGASMAVMGLMPAIYHLMSAGLSPWLGRNLARIGVRRSMLAGSLILPLGMIAISRASSIIEAGLLFAFVVVVGSTALGPLVSNTLITNWYGPSRGKAMGLLASGSTVGGIVLPPLVAAMLTAMGWRDAIAVLALGGMCFAFPVVFRFAVDHPEELGQKPESDPGAPTMAEGTVLESAEDLASGELLRDPQFWLIAASFGLLFCGGLVQVTFFVNYGLSLGLTLQEAGWLMMARAVASFCGQIGLSRLSDRVGQRAVLAGIILAQGLLWYALARPSNLAMFIAAGVGYGFFAGSLMPLRGSMVAAVFGRLHFAKVTGLMVPAAMPIQIAAVPIAGYLFDRSGDYAVAFSAFLFVFPASALLLFFIRDRPVKA